MEIYSYFCGEIVYTRYPDINSSKGRVALLRKKQFS